MRLTICVATLLALAGCEAAQAPRLVSSTPDAMCLDDEVVLTVEGKALDVVLTDALSGEPTLYFPEVRLELTGGLAEGEAPRAERSINLTDEQVTWIDRRTLSLELDEDVALEAGSWDVVVEDPLGREARVASALLVYGAPVVRGLDPAEICQAGEVSELRIQGEGFIAIDGVFPSVTVGLQETAVLAVEDCQPLAGGRVGQVCGTLVVSPPGELLPLGLVELTVDNPEVLGCAASTPAAVEVVPPPVIEDIQPEAICQYGGTFTVTGTRFVEGSTVTVGGQAATATRVHDGELLVDLPAGLEPGFYDLSVTAPDGCTDTIEAGVRVTGAPLLYFVDPPVVYSGLSMEITAYIADVSGEITDVWLEAVHDGSRQEVEWVWSPDDPGRIYVVIPDTTPNGEHLVRYNQGGDCPGDVGGSVVVAWRNRVPIDNVDPTYAWTFDHTPVVISGPETLPTDAEPFLDTPRLYLLGPGREPTTTALLGVNHEGPDRLTAVIPPGLEVGSYRLYLVNPSGNVGVLARAIVVTEDAPPRVFTVSPGNLPNSGNQRVVVTGRDFRNPSVEFDCLDNGNHVLLTGNVTSSSYGIINLMVPTSAVNRGVCLVTVTNEDGTYVRYSAVSITNPAQNLFPWQRGTDMVEARRATAAAAGRVSPVERYVYAIGGDEGDPSTAKGTVEVARIGLYGDMGEWALIPGEIPIRRTMAGVAVVGRFVYVIGGSGPRNPGRGVFRAMILDPLDAPAFTDLSVSGGGNASGLEPGTWSYRVSAVFPTDDLLNPGGQSLASDPITITLPDIGERLRPELTWSEVDRAVAYRVYRSPVVDAGAHSEELLAEVATNRFVDRGGNTDATQTPPPQGSLGAWALAPSMANNRAGPCVAVGWDPNPDPEVVYIFAAGGQDTDGTVHDTIEVLPISIVNDGLQVAGEWTRVPQRLNTARYQCSGFTVGPRDHTVVAEDETWVYFGGGLTENGNAVGEVMAGQVGRGGTFTRWQQVSDITPARAGFAVASASNFLYAFGGQNGTPSQTGASAQITGVTLPDFTNWNSLSTSLSERRYLAGSAQESAVIFVLGGETRDAGATHSTDFTNF